MSTKTAKNGKSGKIRSQKGRDSEKITRYYEARRMYTKWTKKQCADYAGYAPGRNISQIERTPQFRMLWAQYEHDCAEMELEKAVRIKNAVKATGLTAGKMVSVLHSIVVDPNAEQKVKTAAIKVGAAITGERMPEQTEADIRIDQQILDKILNG